MKYPVKLTQAAEKEFLAWVLANCQDSAKLDENTLYAPEAWLDDFELSLDGDRRDYEMGRLESASGNPVLYFFEDDDLVFEEIDE